MFRVQIEAYIDDHPEFLEFYVLRKVDKTMLVKWMTYDGQTNPNKITNSSEISKVSNSSLRKGSITPQRKISISTFTDCSLSPLLSTVEDGSLSFLSHTPDSRRKSTVITDVSKKQPVDDTPTDFKETFVSELNTSKLCFNISKYKAVSTTTLLVIRNGEQINFSGAAVNVKMDCEYKNSFQQNLSFSPKLCNWLTDIVNDRKLVHFNRAEVTRKSIPFLDYKYDHLCLLPLKDADGVVQAVALICLGPHSCTETYESKDIIEMSKLVGICIRNAAEFQSLRMEVIRSQVFLDLARIIFGQETSIEFTVLKILANLIILAESEFAQLVLTNKDSSMNFGRIFDLHADDQLNGDFNYLKCPFENRFPINSGIINLVATVEETVNIEDVSKATIPNSLLCIPLRDNDNSIIAVVTLTNKNNGMFTKDDENFVEAFGVFFSISLENIRNYEAVKIAEAKCQVALDIMSYHSVASEEEFDKVLMDLHSEEELQTRSSVP